MGGYWRGKRWVEITWGDKIKEALKASPHTRKLGRCQNCDKELPAAYKTQKWCGPKCQYHGQKSHPDPYFARAVAMGSTIRLGAGKRQIIAEMLRASVNKPCRYCGQIITLKNCSIDHIEPLRGLRNTPMSKQFDRRENLQIICRRCNGLKGELNHEKYQKLLDFLRTDPEIHRRVMDRLSQSRRFWIPLKGRKRSERP